MKTYPFILIVAGLCLAGIQSAMAQPVGFGGSTPAPTAATASTISNVGVQLSPDFDTTGKFKVQLRVSSDLNQFNESISYTNCAVTNPTPLCCSCDERTVVAGSGGSALDVAIDIDSSGSNGPPPAGETDPWVASDPSNLRLTAAQQVVDALLTGDNRVAAFNFGTSYCESGSGRTHACPPGTADGDFYLGVNDDKEEKFFTYTNPMSNGYVDSGQKEAIKAGIARGITGVFGGTPLFGSLLEVLDDMSVSIQRVSSKVVVVFSDGQPMNDIVGYGEPSPSELEEGIRRVCDRANGLGAKILAIGYGPSSAKSPAGVVEPTAVSVLQRLAGCSGGVYLAIEDVNQIGAQAASLAQSLTEGHLDLSCHLSDPTQILTDESVVDGTATLHLNNGSVGGPVAFSFIPPADSTVPAALPDQDPATVGPTCPQPQTGQPIIDERPPPPACPEGTADIDGDGDCEGMGVLPPPVEQITCVPGAANFPDCLVIDAQSAGECTAAGGHWVAGEGVVIPANLYAEMQRKGHGMMSLPDGTVVKYSTFNGITNWQVMGRCLSEAGAASLSAGGDEGDGSGNCSLTPGAPARAVHAFLLVIPATALWWLRRRRLSPNRQSRTW